MDYNVQRGRTYQILALNEKMFKSGHISREEHDFVRRLQVKKLTNLHGRSTMNVKENDLM